MCRIQHRADIVGRRGEVHGQRVAVAAGVAEAETSIQAHQVVAVVGHAGEDEQVLDVPDRSAIDGVDVARSLDDSRAGGWTVRVAVAAEEGVVAPAAVPVHLQGGVVDTDGVVARPGVQVEHVEVLEVERAVGGRAADVAEVGEEVFILEGSGDEAGPDRGEHGTDSVRPIRIEGVGPAQSVDQGGSVADLFVEDVVFRTAIELSHRVLLGRDALET